MSLRQCSQCNANTKRGTACKRRTCKSPNCFQHNKSLFGLTVKQSTIPASGQGLFAVKPFKKNQTIQMYTGDRLSQMQIDQRYPNNALAPYAVKVRPQYNQGAPYIDARSTQSSIARYANACDRPGNRKPCNAKINAAARLIATKNINTGREVLIPYGPVYFV